MKPIDYIYKNLDSFNISIFKQIVEESGEEVSESIYDYLMETTWNTNPALLKQFGLDIERSSEDEEVLTNKKLTIIQSTQITNSSWLGQIDETKSDFKSPLEIFNYCMKGGAELLSVNVSLTNESEDFVFSYDRFDDYGLFYYVNSDIWFSVAIKQDQISIIDLNN